MTTSSARPSASRGSSRRDRAAFHAPGLGVIAATALVVMRRFVFTGGVPAGTDMLGFVSRAAQNASPGRILDAWSPGSFGARRVFTFDNILGTVTLLTRNPMLTVKLLDVLTLVGSGVGAYALAWSWFRRRRVATIAGVLYMASQASLTRWGSGQLNVEIIIALAPVILLGWSACLTRFSVRRSVGLALALGFGFLVRADLMLYVAPFLIGYAVVAYVMSPARRATLVHGARSLAVVAPATLGINAAWLAPTLTGFRAQYQTLSQIFPTSELSTRSIDLYPSLVGFGREIGYFGFTGLETWFSYPGLPLWIYYAFATVIPVLAYSVVFWHRDHRSVFLVLAAVVATLAAPGSRAPLGAVYLWVIRNVPGASNLRDPNRWLIIQALAYALLAGLAIDRCLAAAPRWLESVRARVAPRVLVGLDARWPRTLRAATGTVLLTASLIPVAPTILVGLRTWHVTASQRALLSAVSSTKGPPGMVATIPFEQDYRYVTQGTYQGYEHDLGYESTLFTGRGAVGDGSWNQRSANLLAYSAGLLTKGDPAFARILGSVGVRDLTTFNYPLVAPQLLSSTVGPYTQQSMVAQMPDLTSLATNPAGTDDTIDSAAAPASFRSDVAVVLGGDQGLASLADWPGIKLSDWAAFTADDVISTSGFDALLSLMRRADLVLVADERPVDIAVEGTTPIASVVGITSDPQLDRLETDVPTDQSAQRGSLYDFATAIPQPLSTTSSARVSVGAARTTQVWVRVLASSQAATIHVSVDGRAAGSVTPVTIGPGGFEWISLGRVRLTKGQHRVTVSASPSQYGDSFEVEEARLVDPAALTASEVELNRALAASAGHVAYAFDLSDAAKWGWAALSSRLAPVGPQAFSLHAWSVPRGADTVMGTVAAPGGQSAVSMRAVAGRSVFSVAEIRYHVAQDWSDRPYVYLEFKGTGSGNLYTVIFDFGANAASQARYVIDDTSSGWRNVAFSTASPEPGGGPPDWSAVTSVRVALATKSTTGTFSLGVPLPSISVSDFTVSLPVVAGTAGFQGTLHPVCVGPAPKRAPVLNPVSQSIALSVAEANSSCRLYAAPADAIRQVAATPVSVRHVGVERWEYSFSATRRGVLVWTQAFDPLWRLSSERGSMGGLPVMSLATGFVLGAGRHSGVLAFDGETGAIVGLALTVGTLLALLGLAAAWRRPGGSAIAGTRRRHERRRSRAARPCLVAGLGVLVACPLASLSGSVTLLGVLCLVALAAMTASVLLGGHRDRPDGAGDAAETTRSSP